MAEVVQGFRDAASADTLPEDWEIIAAHLLAEIENQLRDSSPNNPDWLTSSTFKTYLAWLNNHAPSVSDLAAILSAVNTERYKGTDLSNLGNLRDGNLSLIQLSGEGERRPDSLSPFDYAYRIAYADTVAAIDDFREVSEVADRDTANLLAVSALTATIIRSYYWQEISAQAEADPPFQGTFRQNILSLIYRASYLEAVCPAKPETKAVAGENTETLRLAA